MPPLALASATAASTPRLICSPKAAWLPVSGAPTPGWTSANDTPPIATSAERQTPQNKDFFISVAPTKTHPGGLNRSRTRIKTVIQSGDRMTAVLQARAATTKHHAQPDIQIGDRHQPWNAIRA